MAVAGRRGGAGLVTVESDGNGQRAAAWPQLASNVNVARPLPLPLDFDVHQEALAVAASAGGDNVESEPVVGPSTGATQGAGRDQASNSNPSAGSGTRCRGRTGKLVQ